jgi:hypothetical protein
MSEETKPTGCHHARRRASRCVLLPCPLTAIARRLDDGYLSLTAPRLRPRQRIGQRRARHRMPVAWPRGAGAGEVTWRHPDTFVDSTIEHHTGFPGGAGASGLPRVAHFLSVCRASNLAEARCISSPVQGASPAKTSASSTPSRAHGPPLRPSTNGEKLSESSSRQRGTSGLTI